MTDDDALRIKAKSWLAAADAFLPGPPGGSLAPLIDDGVKFARRLLELLPPADDGEPVTADWYASAGGRTADDGTLSIALPGGEVSMVFYPFGVTTATPQVWLWTRCGALLDVGNTRGHVRRLCTALGIPLTEGK